jgi:acyl-CoA synthetase (AMP-forming)/AMP-acid ligase II
MNIGTLPARHGRYRPGHAALVTAEGRWSYAEFDRRTARLAAGLEAAGVRHGAALATALPNCPALYEIYWAAARIGVATVPLSPLLKPEAIHSLAADAGAALVIGEPARADAIAATVPADAVPSSPPIRGSDVFNIMYSSGTTGVPKGIVLSYGVRAAYCTVLAAQWRMTPESVVLHAGSLVFNGAFTTLMPAMFLGATFVLQTRFDPDAFMDAVERERVTHVMMVPSQIVALLNAPRFDPSRLASLEMLGSVGAPLHREHRDRLVEHLPGHAYELYGLTEGFVTILDNREFARRRDAVGIPIPFSDMRIVGPDGAEVPTGAVGEIVGRGPLLMSGYHKRPDLTALAIVDGWLHSGDMGFVDADGFLHLVDRQKDLIVSGGVNVFPRDIEEVAVAHPAVREAAVFGVPDDKWGEVPVAAIVLREGIWASPDELKQWMNERVAARYQRVSRVVIMDDFPRSTAGKTLKRVMREPYWVERDARI